MLSMCISGSYVRYIMLKDGLSLKIKNLHIHLYFIATKYIRNYALVEDIAELGRQFESR